MIFEYTWPKVLDGTKTVTRRLWKPTWEYTLDSDKERLMIVSRGRVQYYTGQVLSVQQGRGLPGIAKITVLDLFVDEDVRDITDEEVIAEGYSASQDFLATWVSMHDRKWLKYFYAQYPQDKTAGAQKLKQIWLKRKPELYRALGIGFSLNTESESER
jgi:hypothetical protein